MHRSHKKHMIPRDLSLTNLTVKHTIACRGTITTDHLRANDAAFDTLLLRKIAPLPPSPTPIPAPSANLIIDGNLTVDGSSTLDGNLTVIGTTYVGPIDQTVYVNKAG